MKKKNIVKSHQDFNILINNGKKISSKFFVIYYKNNNINRSRYGISVGTKLGNAVFRNKYKRKIRMIVDENNDISKYNKDFIILLRKNGTNLKYNELKEDFDKLIKVIKEK